MFGHQRRQGSMNLDISLEDVKSKDILMLMVSNAAVIVLSLIAEWQLVLVLLVYLIQSIIIGFFWALRILSCANLCRTKNPAPDGQWKRVGFFERTIYCIAFIAHYGYFHFMYLFFVLFPRHSQNPMDSVSIVSLATVGAMFFLSQLASYIKYLKEPKHKPVSVEKFMFIPYIRILPMHFIAALAGEVSASRYGSTAVLALFLVLKTFADVVMQIGQNNYFIEDIDEKTGRSRLPFLLEKDGAGTAVLPDGRTFSLKGRPELAEKLKAAVTLPKAVRTEVFLRLLAKAGLAGEGDVAGIDKPAVKGQTKRPCRCGEIDLLDGREAYDYIESHLTLLGVVRDGEVYHYLCPHTKKRWAYKNQVLESRRLGD